jgi:hypothetical protein
MPKSRRQQYADYDEKLGLRRQAKAREHARSHPSVVSQAWSTASGLLSTGINKLTGETARKAAKAAECKEIERVFNEGVDIINVNWNGTSGMLDGVPYLIGEIQKNMIGMGITNEGIKQYDLTNPQYFKTILGQVLQKGNELLTRPDSMQVVHVFNEQVENAYWCTVHFCSLIEMYKKCLPFFQFIDKFMVWKKCQFEHTLTDHITHIIGLRKHLRDIIQYMDQGVMPQLEALKQLLRAANGKYNPPYDGGKRRTRRHHSRRHRSRRHRSRRCRTN